MRSIEVSDSVYTNLMVLNAGDFIKRSQNAYETNVDASLIRLAADHLHENICTVMFSEEEEAIFFYNEEGKELYRVNY